MNRHHTSTTKHPGTTVVRCTCGWSHNVQHHNAWARSSKAAGAANKHRREANALDEDRAAADPGRREERG